MLADGTPVVNAYAAGLRESTKSLADRSAEILHFLSGTFGRYPFRAAGNVFIDVNDDGPATAPQTRPVYLGAGNEQFMTLDAVVHEQAHQWYGISAAPAKGPLALHELRRQIGDKAFHRLIKQWPQQHRGDYVDWPQFDAFTQKITEGDLTDFFQAWFRGGAVPADKYLWPGTLKP